jgi:CubicO group peptidase (beta-lactamase class C family)
VIALASGQTWNTYFNTKLKDKIGMEGAWFQVGNNAVYGSNTRSMARFGLLICNKGKWESNRILNENYINEATNTSQTINLGYGYLWWLNGKTSYYLPQSLLQFNDSLIPTAPADMFMALGKYDQKIYIIPSKKMVVIRTGNVANPNNPTFTLSDFDEILWQKISALYQ